ncbi:hypothetical protein V2J09_022201 [Rumex salicifolius]
MAPKHHFVLVLIIFLFLLLPNLSLSADKFFEQWISHNVQAHARRRLMLASTTSSRNGLDVKLREAESDVVRLSVSQNSTSAEDFPSINKALASIPDHNTRRVILDIKRGVYREKVHIPKTMSFITLAGDPTDPPTITGNDTASVMGKGGKPIKTFQSATVAIDGDYFVATNIKFENTATHEVGVKGEQAVALRISGTKASFYNCSFYGSQDTLYDHKGLHYFSACFIQGSVDFIFGYATSLYEKCTLNSVAAKTAKAALTAQKRTEATMSSGFSFKECKVTGSGRVYLGRAWGRFSRVVFSYTFMDSLVLPQGWNNWGDPTRNQSVYYGEYKCSGAGANMSGRVPWARALTDEEAKPFIGTYYVQGHSWLLD